MSSKSNTYPNLIHIQIFHIQHLYHFSYFIFLCKYRMQILNANTECKGLSYRYFQPILEWSLYLSSTHNRTSYWLFIFIFILLLILILIHKHVIQKHSLSHSLHFFRGIQVDWNMNMNIYRNFTPTLFFKKDQQRSTSFTRGQLPRRCTEGERHERSS